MDRVLEMLRQEADVVIIDTPPVGPVSDAALLSTKVDGVVQVVQYGTTRRDAVQRAKAAVDQVGGRMVGAVLNRLQPADAGYYYYYYYSTYYQYSSGSANGAARRRVRNLAGKVLNRLTLGAVRVGRRRRRRAGYGRSHTNADAASTNGTNTPSLSQPDTSSEVQTKEKSPED
jgi:Mrp family chromosome partitioning ATPase